MWLYAVNWGKWNIFLWQNIMESKATTVETTTPNLLLHIIGGLLDIVFIFIFFSKSIFFSLTRFQCQSSSYSLWLSSCAIWWGQFDKKPVPSNYISIKLSCTKAAEFCSGTLPWKHLMWPCSGVSSTEWVAMAIGRRGIVFEDRKTQAERKKTGIIWYG